MTLLRLVVFLWLAFLSIASAQSTDAPVVFSASTPGVDLAGTVTSPPVERVAGAVVLLSVAGPTDRDLTLGPHQLFGTLAHQLAEGGIASLRYDARGVGTSGGELLATDFDDRVADACEAMAALRDRIGSSVPIGFLGLSEGAGLALVAAERCGPVAFTVLLSAPVRRGTVEIEAQLTRLIAGSALPEDARQEVAEAGRRFLALVADSAPERHREAIRVILAGPHGPAILPPYAFVPRDVTGRVDFVLSRWYRSQLQYNVQWALERGGAPTLALYGELDQVIDPVANAAHLARLRPAAQVDVVPRLNHLLQEARTGSPLEYGQLPAGIADQIVERVVAFVLAQTL